MIAALGAFGVACGGGSLDSSTARLEDGTEVSAQRYLTDVASATMAIDEFTATLDALGATPNRQQMGAAANALAGHLSDAEIATQRVQAARLADTRLEEQRVETARWMRITANRMAAVVAAAEAAELRSLRRSSSAYAEAVEGLRAAGEASLMTVT